MSGKTWYIEARVGRDNFSGECVRFVDDRRGIDGEYINMEAEKKVAELMEEIAGLKARAEKAERERDALAGNIGRPWGLPSVLERLADAADHLLHHHSCDVHGYEGIGLARDEARALLAGFGR